jgi:hypothetical protein
MGHLSPQSPPLLPDSLIPYGVFTAATNMITTWGQGSTAGGRDTAAIFFTSFTLHQDELTKSIS